MAGERLEWADAYRGFLFCLVMAYHSGGWSNYCPPYLNYILQPFFLAGFFVLSGFFYKDKTLVERLKSIINTLVFPLFAIETTRTLFLSPGLNIKSIGTEFYQQFILGGDSVWFISCLICMEFIYTLYHFLLHDKDKNDILLVLVAIVSYIFITCTTSRVVVNHLPWNIDTSIWCLLFFVIGRYLQKHTIKSNKWISVSLVGVYCVAAIGLNYINLMGGVDIHNNVVYNKLLFLPLSIFGTLTTFCMFKDLNIRCRIFRDMGRYTLFSFPFHCFAFAFLGSVYRALGISDYFVTYNSVLIYIHVLFMCIIMIAVCRVLEVFCPVLLGKVKVLK